MTYLAIAVGSVFLVIAVRAAAARAKAKALSDPLDLRLDEDDK